ncbi:hypothetical protein HanIR_Chr09g0425181 [Helianthus annuus]|nr:hypothetical protein HanIR_Chr09g0425181 [Helianthus annuus]
MCKLVDLFFIISCYRPDWDEYTTSNICRWSTKCETNYGKHHLVEDVKMGDFILYFGF